MNIRYRTATREELPAIAAWIAAQNADPSHQCLHLGDTPEEITNELHAHTDAPEKQIVLAIRTDAEVFGASAIIGLLGAELETTNGHAWLWGPYVTGVDSRDEVASELFGNLSTILPIRPVVSHAYLNVANEWAASLLRTRGFRDKTIAHIYVADAAVVRSATGGGTGLSAGTVDLPDALSASFAEVHDSCFPKTWCAAAEVLKRRARGDRVLASLDADGDRVDGYVHAGLGDGGIEGFIHFLGVREEARRRGVARRLLEDAMRWLVIDRGVPQVALAVSESSNAARALYERVGFRLQVSGLALVSDQETR